MALVDPFEYAARAFEPSIRRWPSPGAMAAALHLKLGQVAIDRTTPALDYLDRELVALAGGHNDRLMIFMPPQEGKSVKVALTYPLWLLSTDPTRRVAIVSFQAGKAERWGRYIRRAAREYPQLGIDWAPDSRAVSRLETRQGGGVIAVGIKGAITGEPVDDLVIDDPFGGRADAESKLYRDAAWDWWESNGATRASGRFRVVLMHTRWHADDMAARMQEHEPGDWRIVSIPAIAEDNDPLGRRPGEELVSVQGRPAGHFAHQRAIRSAYVWSSIYQQRPTVAEGNLFKRGDWRFWSHGDAQLLRLGETGVADLRDCTRFITIDLATSLRNSADFTVASVWAITPAGDLVLLDRARDHVDEAAHFDLVAPLRQRWLRPHDVTYVESRMFGTTLVYAAGRAGLPLAELEADVDKLTRALPAAGLVRQHRVWLPAGVDWLDEWLDEHAEFPNSKHDDQVDTTSYAARVAIAHWLPAQATSDIERQQATVLGGSSEAVDLAYYAATGGGSHEAAASDW